METIVFLILGWLTSFAVTLMVETVILSCLYNEIVISWPMISTLLFISTIFTFISYIDIQYNMNIINWYKMKKEEVGYETQPLFYWFVAGFGLISIPLIILGPALVSEFQTLLPIYLTFFILLFGTCPSFINTTAYIIKFDGSIFNNVSRHIKRNVDKFYPCFNDGLEFILSNGSWKDGRLNCTLVGYILDRGDNYIMLPSFSLMTNAQTKRYYNEIKLSDVEFIRNVTLDANEIINSKTITIPYHGANGTKILIVSPFCIRFKQNCYTEERKEIEAGKGLPPDYLIGFAGGFDLDLEEGKEL